MSPMPVRRSPTSAVPFRAATLLRWVMEPRLPRTPIMEGSHEHGCLLFPLAGRSRPARYRDRARWCSRSPPRVARPASCSRTGRSSWRRWLCPVWWSAVTTGRRNGWQSDGARRRTAPHGTGTGALVLWDVLGEPRYEPSLFVSVLPAVPRGGDPAPAPSTSTTSVRRTVGRSPWTCADRRITLLPGLHAAASADADAVTSVVDARVRRHRRHHVHDLCRVGAVGANAAHVLQFVSFGPPFCSPRAGFARVRGEYTGGGGRRRPGRSPWGCWRSPPS